MAEKLSVVMARRHIRMANVVLLVSDATRRNAWAPMPPSPATRTKKAARLILCVNKWDATPEKSKRAFTESVRDELKFLDYAPVIFVSAKNAEGISEFSRMIRRCFEAASKRVTTGELNRFVETLEV